MNPAAARLIRKCGIELGSSPLAGEEAKTWAYFSKPLVFAGEGSENRNAVLSPHSPLPDPPRSGGAMNVLTMQGVARLKKPHIYKVIPAFVGIQKVTTLAESHPFGFDEGPGLRRRIVALDPRFRGYDNFNHAISTC